MKATKESHIKVSCSLAKVRLTPTLLHYFVKCSLNRIGKCTQDLSLDLLTHSSLHAPWEIFDYIAIMRNNNTVNSDFLSTNYELCPLYIKVTIIPPAGPSELFLLCFLPFLDLFVGTWGGGCEENIIINIMLDRKIFGGEYTFAISYLKASQGL